MVLESEQNYTEPVAKKTGKTRSAPKIKQIDEGKKEPIIKKQKSPPKFDGTDDSGDGDLVFESPDQNYTEPIAKKTVDAPKPKLMDELEKESIIKKQKSPPKSDGYDSGDGDLKLETLEIKPKRGVKKVKSNVETKDAEDKPKKSKRVKKIKGDNLEDRQNCSPPNGNEVEEVKDKSDVHSDTPDSDKTDIKPKIKRKTKAKK